MHNYQQFCLIKNQTSKNKYNIVGIIILLESFLGDNKSLFFDLKHDSGELNNILDIEPAVSLKLLAIIQDELKMANNRIRKGE